MKKTFQEKEDNYQNGNCPHKIFCRESFVAEVKKSNIHQLRYVGLPARWGNMEIELLNEYFDATMFLGEIHLDVFENQKSLPLFNKNLSVYQDIIHSHGDVFNACIPFKMNAIWLDLCNIFKASLLKKIIKFIKNNEFEGQGVFALTIAGGREHDDSQQIYKALQKNYLQSEYEGYPDFRNNQFGEILALILSEYTNRKFEKVSSFPYGAGQKNPMIFHLLKWT